MHDNSHALRLCMVNSDSRSTEDGQGDASASAAASCPQSSKASFTEAASSHDLIYGSPEDEALIFRRAALPACAVVRGPAMLPENVDSAESIAAAR